MKKKYKDQYTNKELDELFLQMQSGDEEAFEKIWNASQWQVHSLVKPYKSSNSYEMMRDIYQAAFEGLMDAIRTHEVGKGKFPWFCYYKIREKISKQFRLVKQVTTPQIPKGQIKEFSINFEEGDAEFLFKDELDPYKVLKLKEDQGLIKSLKKKIKEGKIDLSDIEKDALEKYYFEYPKWTFQRIADKRGVTKMAAFAAVQRALKKLKEELK